MLTFASARLRNHCSERCWSRNLPLNDSSAPFCQGLPGSMNAVSICAVCSQRRIGRRDELRAVVGAQVARRAVDAHELRQHLDDAAGSNAAGDVDRQAFPRELVDDRQALQRAAIGARVEDEVVRPDVIDRRRRQRPRATGRHAAARPLLRHLQRLLPPQAIHAIGAHARGPGARGRSESSDSRSADTAPANVRIAGSTGASRAISRDT